MSPIVLFPKYEIHLTKVTHKCIFRVYELKALLSFIVSSQEFSQSSPKIENSLPAFSGAKASKTGELTIYFT